MLVTIGQSRRAPGDLVDHLLACHERIRSFVALARAGGERADVSPDEIVDACLRVERYFIEALPLHVADEEEGVLPRLRGRSPDLDAVLRTMHEHHARQEPKLGALLRASSDLRVSPSDAARRLELAAAAKALEDDFREHLALEEEMLFPAIRALSEQVKAEIGEELRARRGERPTLQR